MEWRKIEKIIKIFKAKEGKLVSKLSFNNNKINGKKNSIDSLKAYTGEMTLGNDVSPFILKNYYAMSLKIEKTIEAEEINIKKIEFDNAIIMKEYMEVNSKIKSLEDLKDSKKSEEDEEILEKEEDEILRIFNLLKSVKKN